MEMDICVSSVSTYIAQKEIFSVKYETKIHLNEREKWSFGDLCLTVSDSPRNACFSCDWSLPASFKLLVSFGFRYDL